MLLHDQLVLESSGLEVDDPLVERLALANAAPNVLCCVGWSALAGGVRAPPTALGSPPGGCTRRRSGDSVNHDQSQRAHQHN